MRLLTAILLAAVALPAQAPAAAPSAPLGLTIPSGTRLQLMLPQRTRLHHVGQPITVRVSTPVYADNQLALPVGTEVAGQVEAIRGPGWWPRVQAGIGGDFSPAPTVTVRFTAVAGTDGTWQPLQAAMVPGTPILRMVTASQNHSKAADLERQISLTYHQQEDAFESLLRQQTQWQTVKQEAVDSLPYRPASLLAGTHYDVMLTAPLTVAAGGPPPPPVASLPAELPPGLVLHAELETGLSSATSHWGAPVDAVLTEPASDSNGTMVLPQGTKLVGEVVEAHPARHFGRGGKLRFIFSHVELPSGEQRQVTTRLAGAATSSAAVSLDSESGAKASRPGGPAPYVALGVVLASSLTGGDADNAWATNAGSGTHLRIWGTAIALLLTRAQSVALVLGYAGSARTIYQHWIGPGPQITFPAGTGLLIQITAPEHHGPVIPK